MDWIFIGVIVISAGYLIHMIMSFLYRLNEIKPRIDYLNKQIEKQTAEADKSETRAMEAERKVGEVEEEVLKYEKQTSDLQARINIQKQKNEELENQENPPSRIR